MRTAGIGMRTRRNPYVLLRYVQYTLAEILEYDFSAKMNNKKLVAGGGRCSDRLTCRGQGTGTPNLPGEYPRTSVEGSRDEWGGSAWCSNLPNFLRPGPRKIGIGPV